jgi:hemerythrin-like domain-containing protein
MGMIAEEGSINNLLIEHDALTILIDALLHKAITVKRNSAEALAFFVKDETVREGIGSDRVL